MASKQSLDTIDLSHLLLEQLSSLYLSDKDSDIVFIIDGERIYAHKFVLMLRCEYFRLMFLSGLKEAIESEVRVKETSLPAFKAILNYIYTGQVQVNDKKIEDIIDILCLGHRYELQELVSNLIEYLESNITVENVCAIYGTANLYCFTSLIDLCYKYLLNRGFEMIQHESFYSFNAKTLIKLFSNDEYCAEEIDIFKAIIKWMELNPHCDELKLNKLISTVRLPLICWDDLIAFVWPSALFGKDQLLTAIQQRTDDLNIDHRNCVTPVNSLEEISHGVLEKATIYRRPYECSESLIFSIPGSVTIKFDGIRFINYIEFHLGNCEKTGYSYYIEASINYDGEWIRIADYTDYRCHSTQYIYFPKGPIQYLRIYGTRCTGGGTNFIIDSFKSMIREYPSSMYFSSRNKSDLDYISENRNKSHAPLYARPVDICRSKSSKYHNPLL